jgi:putative endonuclease
VKYYFVNILQSEKDGSFYVGQTDDLDIRVSKHNQGLSRYTSTKRLLKLVYFEVYPSRSEAVRRESQIKKQKSRTYIWQLIENWKKVE